MQSEQDAAELFAQTGIVSLAVFGGIDYDKQAKQLKDGVDVIFATPGRLMDYIKKKWVRLDHVQTFVCDEADRMFDMGFIEDVEFFLERIPETAQRLPFSATTKGAGEGAAFESSRRRNTSQSTLKRSRPSGSSSTPSTAMRRRS